MKPLLLVIALLLAPPVLAAPFCVQDRFGDRCWFYDAQSCREDAAQSDGICVVQMPDRLQGRAPFCAIDRLGARCWFYSASDCRRDVGNDGACIANPNN